MTAKTNELDKANFPSSKSKSPGCKQAGNQVAVSAAEFHPVFMEDEVHEKFIEETREGGVSDQLSGEVEINTPVSYKLLPKDSEDVPMSVHLEYCSEQLSKFEMEGSDEEEGNMEVELQCLLEELAVALGSVKRSLFESVDKAENEKKKKLNSEKNATWGPVLVNRSRTREHGNVKIMDKANAYLSKKNLEIPATFKGSYLEKCQMHNGETECSSSAMEGPMRRCPSLSVTAMHTTLGQTPRGTSSHRLEMIKEAAKLKFAAEA